ncbi:MAG: diguanylate cyclase [Colwellia sp.]|nr:diguanylate cyclase [Colwellia sp.]
MSGLETYCAEITDKLNCGILLLDVDLKLVMWNQFLEVHANKKLAEIAGQSIFSIFPELPQRWFERKITSVVQLGTPSFCSWEQRHHLFELPHTRPITTGSEFMAQNCTFSPIKRNNKIEHICILIEDVTDVCYYQSMLKKTMNDLALSNRIDGLTQIFNRKHWEDCLAQEFAKARRHDHKISLIMFDLDHFKLLNDKYGHQGGDRVLIDIAENVTSMLRLGDIFGRYGGEEFAIILPETDIKGASELADRLQKSINQADIIFQKNCIKTSVSIGVAELDKAESHYESLISKADIALYKAKSSGRNQFCVYE